MAKQNHCVGNLMSQLILSSCIFALVKFISFAQWLELLSCTGTIQVLLPTRLLKLTQQCFILAADFLSFFCLFFPS